MAVRRASRRPCPTRFGAPLLLAFLAALLGPRALTPPLAGWLGGRRALAVARPFFSSVAPLPIEEGEIEGEEVAAEEAAAADADAGLQGRWLAGVVEKVNERSIHVDVQLPDGREEKGRVRILQLPLGINTYKAGQELRVRVLGRSKEGKLSLSMLEEGHVAAFRSISRELPLAGKVEQLRRSCFFVWVAEPPGLGIVPADRVPADMVPLKEHFKMGQQVTVWLSSVDAQGQLHFTMTPKTGQKPVVNLRRVNLGLAPEALGHDEKREGRSKASQAMGAETHGEAERISVKVDRVGKLLADARKWSPGVVSALEEHLRELELQDTRPIGQRLEEAGKRRDQAKLELDRSIAALTEAAAKVRQMQVEVTQAATRHADASQDFDRLFDRLQEEASAAAASQEFDKLQEEASTAAASLEFDKLQEEASTAASEDHGTTAEATAFKVHDTAPQDGGSAVLQRYGEVLREHGYDMASLKRLSKQEWKDMKLACSMRPGDAAKLRVFLNLDWA